MDFNHEKKTWVETFKNSIVEPALSTICIQLHASETMEEATRQMKEICLLSKDDNNKRVAMEFLYANGCLSELAEMIEYNNQSDNPVNHKWASVYSILLKRRTNENITKNARSSMQYLEAIEKINMEEEEHALWILKHLLYVYCYFDNHQYGKIGDYNDSIRRRMSLVKDPLLQELLDGRLAESLMVYHWKRNEMLISRKYGYHLLQSTCNWRKKIDIHNMMAQGYLYDSYDQAMYHVNEALRIAESLEYDRAIYGLSNYTKPFISAYYREVEGIETEDQAEKAHLLLAQGKRTEAIEILEKLENLTPFQQYYLGKARNDRSLLFESYQRFVNERNDYFYARLPHEALEKLEGEEWINE
ncbi:AimR family lysis-lysogeny pheromone receptor [Saliterribacillus persicus]|uniref:Uncharacterized protein n=1 Tax=Saliterribacillus persicus TaxID=930114 RepID=A0A368YDP9_9BACI|nr:AimR family lysis-lysogeny pheromone receptor [Saliterribacillus persicus]RCW77466.1 hypothetical protein DFR57_101340 [Saliterribacillus persicus]